ncbi:DNA-directed RNA polymerase subunit beta [Bacillus taeanensis]|uniref:DNA-directed RNA polymerase subunit beta n=1 Tax=Bacillus taeanensis TaxID=273032 RepID=A0A366XUX9_9BACI|nr:DNA-directed RNA polymerase subunit beta [Bacillus taeanensis]RBW68945.1 DNA-directed RNA polymerase subunit beta [Bacillus taeanensis]
MADRDHEEVTHQHQSEEVMEKEETNQVSKWKRFRLFLKAHKKRVFPIWLRLVLISFFLILSAVIGAMVGYGILGGGQPMEVFQLETWQHILDIVTKNNN